MEAGVQKLYEPSPMHILHVGPAANVLGRVPLMLLFLRGNFTPSIPHQLRQHLRGTFLHGKKGSNFYVGQEGKQRL